MKCAGIFLGGFFFLEEGGVGGLVSGQGGRGGKTGAFHLKFCQLGLVFASGSELDGVQLCMTLPFLI